MQAWRVHDHGPPPEVLRLEDVPQPVPAPHQVRIRVDAAGLNFADYLMCLGQYQQQPKGPFVPGMEVTGRVVETGSTCGEWMGRRVVAVTALPAGGLAEECLADAMNTYAIPDSMDTAQAAGMLIIYQTSHIALHRRANLQASETLLVHAGAGGVGSAAVQLGVAAGARVIATSGGAEKVEVCRSLGADRVVDYRVDDFVDVVLDATEGRGADVIYDPVGGEVFERSRKCIASEGRILVIGFAGGRPGVISAVSAMLKNYSIVGVYMGAYPERQRDVLDWHHEEVLRLFETGEARSLIHAEVGLPDVPQAIADLAARKTTGKVVVRF